MSNDQHTATTTGETGELNTTGEDFVGELVAGRLTWSYRRMLCASGEHQVREVYLRCDGTVAGWVDGPVALIGDDADDLRSTYEWLARAFTEPVLVETELPGYQP